MRSAKLLASTGLIALALLGCAGEDDPPPMSTTTTTTTPPGGPSLPGLDGEVEVIVDDRGMPHIHATTLHDATMVQGYLMARDRFAQMEFFRRNTTGRLAEMISLPETIAADISARVMGHQRTAERIYSQLDAADPVKVALDAFAAGVNVYIQELRDGTAELPDGCGVLELFLLPNPEVFTDWRPQDSLALGRYLSAALSYDGDGDLYRTETAAMAAAAFPAGDPRAGIFQDFWSMAPARAVFTRDGFPNVGTDGGTTAKPSPPQGPPPISGAISLDALARARTAGAQIKRHLELFGDETRGSNNWLVSGAKTASGAPLLVNDPHLTLPSPPLFWYVHLSTQRAGGDLNVQGLALVGVPGAVFGYNDHIAWGSTTAGFDVTDVYQETITEGQGGAPDTVLFKGQQVPIEIITETIKVSGSDDIVLELENVPHHGVILPEIVDGQVVPRTATDAVSVRWTGDQPSSEIATFYGLNVATSLDEAQAALDRFEVGAQNFVVVSREGDIFWSTQSRVPVRDAAAMTYDPATGMGLSPAMVLPGDGSAEWIGSVDERYLPHDLNPTRGYIATANADPVGATADGNPFNDPHYVGWDYDVGHRVARISERLDELTTRGGITPEEMGAVQGDHQSALGRLLAPSFVAAAQRVAEERATPGTHPDLAELVTATPAAELDALADAAMRLSAWSFEAATGVDIGDGAPAQAEVDDAIATSIFNVTLPHLLTLAFDDESTAIGRRPGTGLAAKVLQWAILEPQRLATFDVALGDTVLWDDVATPAVQESRDERIARAMLLAIGTLRTRLGDDAGQWAWGRLHTLRLVATVPSISGGSPADIPVEGDATFPDGFPRPGDNFGIDAASYSMWSTDVFSFDTGPVQRVVVEMTPDGPRAWNAIPGGQSMDPASPHHRDDMELWRRNQVKPLYFTDADVDAHVEERLTFIP